MRLWAAMAKFAWPTLGAISIAFHFWLIFAGLVPNLVSRPLHMALALPWVLLWLPDSATTKRPSWLAWALTIIGVAACCWIAWHEAMLADQYGSLEGSFQTVVAAVLLLVVLEVARRAVGWPLPMLAALALIYGMFGQHLPGEFGHAGTPLDSFLGTPTIAEGGLWGSLTGVSVSIVAIFVIFGAILNAGQAGTGFMNVAAAAAGRLRGGAAKVSVISSALFGSISGLSLIHISEPTRPY